MLSPAWWSGSVLLGTEMAAGGMDSGAATVENSRTLPPTVKHGGTAPGILLPGLDPREMKTYVHTKTCTRISTATLFTTAKRWNQPKWLTPIERIMETGASHTLEY